MEQRSLLPTTVLTKGQSTHIFKEMHEAVNAGNSEGKSVVADYMESNSVRKHWLGAVKGAQRKSML